MNIFVLDSDPKMSAYAHCDDHVKEMIPVYAQILCNTHHLLDPEGSIIKDLESLDPTFPFIQNALSDGSLSIHGLWHNIGTGELMSYDSESNDFILV